MHPRLDHDDHIENGGQADQTTDERTAQNSTNGHEIEDEEAGDSQRRHEANQDRRLPDNLTLGFDHECLCFRR